MKKTLILSGAAAAVVLCTMDASAQLSYQNGDLLAAFGNGATGSGAVDVIVDLGAISNFQQPGATSTTWNIGSILSSVLGDESGIYWGIFGVNDPSAGGANGSVTQSDPNTVWVSLGRPNPSIQTHAPATSSSSLQQLAVTDVETIGSLTSPNEASPGLIVNQGANAVSVSTSLGGFSPMMTGAFNGNFQGDWTYNILNTGAGTSDLYQSDPSSPRAGYLGNFVLDPSGNLTFNPVPEPSTWAMLGSGAVALLALRRRNK